MSDDNITEINMDRRQFIAAASAVGATAFAGCTGGDAGGSGGSDGTETSGGSTDSSSSGNSGETVRVNVALAAEPWNFDPALWTDTATSTIGGLIYDEVIELTPDSELQPGLVTEVPDPVDGGTAFEYTLREGITFHNGDEVTVEDFKYSVDWILNPDNKSPVKSRLPFVEDTEIVGDRTLRLNLSQPFGTLNWWLTRGLEGIVPEGSRGDTADGKGPSGLATDLTQDPSGAGTGAFKFVEWKSGSHVLLEKNEDYWKEGAPAVDEFKFDFIGEDSTRLANLRSGQLDLTDKVPPKDFESLSGQPDITTESVPGNFTQVLYVNLMESEGNPMSNRHNRRAVLFGIDREEILDEVFYGQGAVQKGPWYPDSDWTSPKLKEMQMYDPEKAKKELELAGNPDGFEMDIIATKGSWFKDEAVVIQNQLSEIGIEASVTAVDKSTLLNQVYSTDTWHAAMEDWAQSIPVATSWLDAGYADNNHNHNNWHHPSDDLEDIYAPSGPAAPEDADGDFSNGHEWYVSKLREAQASTDEQEQKEIVWELEEYLVEHGIQIDIAYVNKLEAWRNAVNDYDVGTFQDNYRFVSKGE
ncbi:MULTISPECIES: ABC transporter substrate-binding protein [unclassified Haloferax]|uniref:ABC transporter substrate-binding protein n=1 Tax=Haloferax sp. Atlit-48N TaxID=2077198 RepID=A0ACD5HVI8_9EURY|nr:MULTISPECIES: ABC transporter substrate-binding protein [unclassified Haloferax]ELZ55958.1 putative dipeptides/oligopeptides ABC transporter periplasmic substrate-binding protein [Haloferax sp. ATCC BAA-646]ELZ67713.1 putative dipeptides/oligopeptides ABC transporter periplasmic substrate-binding protein [Haloferax sp. ATCC BAA-645]ELZ68283.1 putative dipeptides/oligopeptides ABC transporter periplasmic substrate-binding protein [Haloferax sp. ATCC BAA-644]RDZ31218.1 ABC transporter substrat